MGAALIAKLASSLSPSNFAAASSLAEQQARSILASKLRVNASKVEQVGIWGRCYGNVTLDTSQTRVHNFQGAITGPHPFSLPVERCVSDPRWLREELPKLVSVRHNHMEGYGGETGGGVSEAVSLADMVAEWCRGREEESR